MLCFYSNLTTVITNGVGANTLLLGNQLNPASAVAQKMTDTLHAELEAHSIYKDEEEKMTNLLVGPAIPGKKEVGSKTYLVGIAWILSCLSWTKRPVYRSIDIVRY